MEAPKEEVGHAAKLIYKRKKRKPAEPEWKMSSSAGQLKRLQQCTTTNNSTKMNYKISAPTRWAIILLAILFCDTSSLVSSEPAQPLETNTTATTSMQTTISSQPSFSQEPKDSVALLGRPVDLSCLVAHKSSAVSLFWYRGSETIGIERTPFQAFAQAFQLSSQEGQSGDAEPSETDEQRTNYTLHINAATWRDDANFSCALLEKSSDQLRNPAWSRAARLTVLKAPSELYIRVMSLEQDQQQEVVSVDSGDNTSRVQVRHGQRIRLECRSDQSKPHAELIWLDHEQAQVERFSRKQIEENGHELATGTQELVQADERNPRLSTSTSVWYLTVQRQLHSDQALTCLAKHAAFDEPQAIPQLYGRELRRQVLLEVLYAPQVHLERLGPAVEGEPMRFRCQADAKPASELAYRWFIDDQLAANGSDSELYVARLTRQLHLREVRCEVRNSVGSGSGSIRLAVQHGPAFVSHLLPASLQPSEPADTEWASVGQQLAQAFDEGQDVSLRCDFDAYPALHQVLWFKVNSDYSTMANVTPGEADELIAGGAAHALLRAAGSGPTSLDYELMSAELLDELALYEQQPGRARIIQALSGEHQQQMLAQTSARIYEPLDWHLRWRPLNATATFKQPTMTQELGGAGQELELLSTSAGRHRFVQREATISSSSITIRRASVDSVGRYVCKAIPSAGSAESGRQAHLARSLFLVMRRPPRIVSHQEQFAPLGSSQVKLDCLAQINMVLDNSTSFVWSRDGKIIESVSSSSYGESPLHRRSVVISSQRSPDLLFMRSELTINQAQLADFGTYQCTIKNSIDTDSLLISLKLTAPTGLAFAYMASLAIGSILILACIVGLLLAFASIGASPKANPENDSGRKLPGSPTSAPAAAARCTQAGSKRRAKATKFAAIHESLEHKLQLGTLARNEHTLPVPVAASPAEKSSLLGRLWRQLFGANNDKIDKRSSAPSAAKSRPSISLPVSVTSQRASSSLKRSSISTSLSALALGGAPEVSLQEANKRCNTANQVTSSQANLIQDSATGSDRSASAGPSGRSSQSSRQDAGEPGAANVELAGHLNATYAGSQPSCYLVQAPAWTAASQAQPPALLYHGQQSPADYFVSVQLDQQSSYQIAGQQPISSPASPNYQPQQIYSKHLPAPPLVDPSSHMISGFTSQPLGWIEHNQSAPSNHGQLASPIYQAGLAVQAGDICNGSNSSNINCHPMGPASGQRQYHMVPTSDSGDAFFESNYGTLLSRSSVYKTLGYTNSSPPACANLPNRLQTGGSTGSSSPSSMTTHANHNISLGQENNNYQAPTYQSAADFRLAHNSPDTGNAQGVILDSLSSSSSATITCNLIKNTCPATHV